MTKPVLLIGGYGKSGSQTARLLRHRNPSLPLVLAGRRPLEGEAFAAELGDTSVAKVDFGAPGLGLASTEFAAMVLFAKDHTGRSLEFAGSHGIPYLSISSGAFEIGLDMTHGLIGARGAPIVLGSLWFAGIIPIAAAHLARRFAAVDNVEVGVVIDRSDSPSGAATVADFQRISMCPATLIREAGDYTWVMAEMAKGVLHRSDGHPLPAEGAVSCDVWSIGQTTGSPRVRVLQSFDQSASSAAGGPAADEIILRMDGRSITGHPLSLVQTMIAYRENGAATAVTTTILAERLAALHDEPLPPGLYSAENAIDPGEFMSRAEDAGIFVTISEA